MKLFIWDYSKDYVWERVTVIAETEDEARKLVLEKGTFIRKEVIEGPPTDVHVGPAFIYDCY